MDYTDLPEIDPNTALAMYAEQRRETLAMLQLHLKNRREAHLESLDLDRINTTDWPDDERRALEERLNVLHRYCNLIRWETVPGLIAIIRRIDQILYAEADPDARH